MCSSCLTKLSWSSDALSNGAKLLELDRQGHALILLAVASSLEVERLRTRHAATAVLVDDLGWQDALRSLPNESWWIDLYALAVYDPQHDFLLVSRLGHCHRSRGNLLSRYQI